MVYKKYKKSKKSYSSLVQKVNKMAVQNKPEVKRKFVQVFDSQAASANYALTQTLATSRILSTLVTGSNDSNVIGSKIFLKGIKVNWIVTTRDGSQDGINDISDICHARLMVFTASSSALATRATPVIGDILIAPEGDFSDLASMVDNRKVSMKMDKFVNSTSAKGVSRISKYIKINKQHTFADSNADISGSTLGKYTDWYLAFIGSFAANATDIFATANVSCEVLIYYTDV